MSQPSGKKTKIENQTQIIYLLDKKKTNQKLFWLINAIN